MPSSGDAILPPPKAVLFDVDGTLVDTMELILQTLGETYRRHLGVEIPAEDIRGIIGRPLEVQVRWFDDRATRKPDHEAMIRFQIVAYEAGKQLEHPIPEALETVRVCARKGIRTALVTSKEQNEFSHTLPRLELNGSLNATVNSSEVSHPKPAPDTALLAC